MTIPGAGGNGRLRVKPLASGLIALLAWVAATLGQAPSPVAPEWVVQEEFATDADGDGEPDGWYNRRDADVVPEGPTGSLCLRFRNDRPGRPARISRAFGVDGQTVEALRVGLWVKAAETRAGERLGENAGLMIDLLGEDVRSVGRRVLGPWTSETLGDGWVHVARRLPVPPSARDGILTVGLLGATGTLWIDSLTVEALPRGGARTPELLLNGDFELGDPDPADWALQGGARRIGPGQESDAALELAPLGAKATTGVGVPVRGLTQLKLSLSARAEGLRATGGASADVFFLDTEGRTLLPTSGHVNLPSGTFPWRTIQAAIPVPSAAARAVLQIEKTAAGGALWIDDATVKSSPDASTAAWTPYHETDQTERWPVYRPAPAIAAGSGLDASVLLSAPAGGHGRVSARQGHLVFEDGSPTRFLGVSLLPPAAFLPAESADALALDLARRGVNLVRLSDLDTPLGPGVSLLDDARDDTKALDPEALDRLDHLIAALKARGLYIALELQGQRRYRSGDGIEEPRTLPPGGGPAAAFDPTIRLRAMELAGALLSHVNPATGLALRDDPVLAWVTLAGELSLFDLIDRPDALDAAWTSRWKDRLPVSGTAGGRRAWQTLEGQQWEAEAKALRELGLKAPIAGSSHWRREPEFVATELAPGLSLIDDRLYWRPPPWGPANHCSLAWDAAGLRGPAARKRRSDRPYVVGEWASHTGGGWALPYEAADLFVVTRTALAEGWDGVVRRGVYPYPAEWGTAAPGTGGGPDVFPVPEAVNANPQLFAMLPHAASLVLRRDADGHRARSSAARGRVALESSHTIALVGWSADRFQASAGLGIELRQGFAAAAVSALGTEPLSRSGRLLATVVGRVEPTGLAWSSTFRREVADPGVPPLRMERVRAVVTWTRKVPVRVFALDSAGNRKGPVPVTRDGDTWRAELETGSEGTQHWEFAGD